MRCFDGYEPVLEMLIPFLMNGSLASAVKVKTITEKSCKYKAGHLLENCFINYKEWETNILSLTICKPIPTQILYFYKMSVIVCIFIYIYMHMLKI